MRKLDRIPREILHRVTSGGERFITQSDLAESCGLSPSTVSPAVKRLEWAGAVERRPRGFRVVDREKLLTYWSVRRDLPGDIEYSTYVPERPGEIASDLPDSVIHTGYTGYGKYMGEVPGHYDEVYVYGDAGKIENRFPPRPGVDPNLFVLDTDEHLRGLSKGDVVPVPQLQADLWWMGKLGARLSEKLEEVKTGGRMKRLTESLRERLEEQAPGPLTCSVCGRAAPAGGAESLKAGGEEFVLCSDCKTSTFKPADQAVRIWGELNLPPRVLEKTLEILGRARDENLVSGRSPRGVAAGTIYVASAVFGEDKSQKDIATAAGISLPTLRNRYKDLGNELDILPEGGEIP